MGTEASSNERRKCSTKGSRSGAVGCVIQAACQVRCAESGWSGFAAGAVPDRFDVWEELNGAVVQPKATRRQHKARRIAAPIYYYFIRVLDSIAAGSMCPHFNCGN